MKNILLRTVFIKITTFLCLIMVVNCSRLSTDKPEEELIQKVTQEIESDNYEEEAEHNDVHLTDEMIKKLNLEFDKVSMRKIRSFISAPAKVTPVKNLEAFVGSIIDGRVQEIFVNQGDYVKKGQILAKIVNFQIGEIKGEYLKSKAEFEFEKENLQRIKSLFESNISSKKSYLLAQAEYEKAKGEFLAVREKLVSIGITDQDIVKSGENENTNLPILDIKAPISGKIVERDITVGEYIESTRNLFRIIDISKLWVDADIYEKDISKIKLGQNVDIIVKTYPDKIYKGEIIYIGDVLNTDTKTLTIRTILNNPENILKPYMFSTVRIYYGDGKSRLTVSTSAVESSNDEKFVFIVEDANVFEKRNVICGIESDGLTEIIAGLEEGENVVIKGSFILRSELEKSKLLGGHQH